jgi:hypothetical protein
MASFGLFYTPSAKRKKLWNKTYAKKPFPNSPSTHYPIPPTPFPHPTFQYSREVDQLLFLLFWHNSSYSFPFTFDFLKRKIAPASSRKHQLKKNFAGAWG